jgi:hypothetical protein
VEPTAVTNLNSISNLTVDAAIGRFHLRELAAANLAAHLSITGGQVNLTNLQTSLNGAPINARFNANLAVPGYTYDVAFNATRIPLAPLADSFMPPYAKDGLRGEMTCSLAVKGAGITGKNLREHLTGGFYYDVTNGAIVVKTLITPGKTEKSGGITGFLAVLTDILDPLLNGVGSVLGMPGLVAEPFATAKMEMQFGGGAINLRDFTLANSKIIVASQGAIPIADDLMASPLKLPVEVYLARQLASRFRIANAPEQATHVKLPSFVEVGGTLGNSKTTINKEAVLGTALTEIGKAVGGKEGELLKGIGSLFGGSTKAVTNVPPVKTPATNAPVKPPPTNQPAPPLGNLLDNLLKPKPKPKQ